MMRKQPILIIAICFGHVLTQTRVGERCLDKYTQTIGKCAPAQSCNSARVDLQTNGIQPTFCSHSYENPLVCCRDGTNFLQTPQPVNRDSPQLSRPSSNSGGKRISELKCEEYSKDVTQTVDFLPLLPEPETMSISSAKCNYGKVVELIVGGEDADLGEFPHMAAIGWLSITGDYSFKCGGTLISENFVLTAGHCMKIGRDTTVSEAEPSVVRLGDLNINPSVNDGANPIQISIKRQIKHPNYKSPNRYNDIALLELATSVEFETNIRPACLWTRNDFGGRPKGIATGWGVVNTRTQDKSDILQKVSLTLLENNYCDRLLEGIRNRHWKGFQPTQMCAGELRGGRDSCQGDSGGPLQIASKDNYCVFYVIGITSFGSKCAESGKPAIYTRVSAYLDWIESVVWPNGY